MHNNNRNTLLYLYLIYFIYFFCGMAQCFESVFPNEFIEYFHLNNTQWAYTSLAKNSSFLILSIPVGYIASRIGYRKCLTTAMLLYAAGTLLILPALHNGWYWLILVAFFIVGAGFNFQLVVGNPLLSLLGRAEGSASRLNLGNALGAVAWIIAPLLITLLVPAEITHAAEKIPYMMKIFTVIASILVVTVIATFLVRDITQQVTPNVSCNNKSRLPIWKNAMVLLGFVAIFLVLGTEGGIFSFYQVYLKKVADVLPVSQKEMIFYHAGLQLNQSQLMFTIFFTLYAVGRIMASVIQHWVKPVYTVIGALVVSVFILSVISWGKPGIVSIGLLTFLGLFISILFPTIYAMAIEGLGADTAKASGILTMGFLGGSVIPLIQGKLGDLYSIGFSFVISVAAYLLVLLYALYYLKVSYSSKTSS